MFAHRGPRLWLISLAAGFALLVLPQAANAAAPVCDTVTRVVSIPAGSSHENPRAPCTAAAVGDAIMVKLVTPPAFGALSPSGDVSIDDRQTYTADADAARETDTMTFRAFVGADESEPFSVEVRIDDPDRAPGCEDADLEVQAGKSVDVPLSCVDPDLNTFDIQPGTFDHGTYDASTGQYTAPADFAGQDTMTYTATDQWGMTSDPATVTITVTKPPSPPVTHPPVTTHPSPPLAAPDVKAPSLDLVAAASMKPRAAMRRGIAFTATTNEAGTLAVQLFVGRNTARRYGLAKNPAGRVLVGSLTRDTAAGATTFKVKLTGKARKRLRKAAQVSLKLIVRITDAAGNARTRRLTIVLDRT